MDINEHEVNVLSKALNMAIYPDDVRHTVLSVTKSDRTYEDPHSPNPFSFHPRLASANRLLQRSSPAHLLAQWRRRTGVASPKTVRAAREARTSRRLPGADRDVGA